MKITGAEFKEWMQTAWPEGYVWADESTLEDGRDLYAPDTDDNALVVADREAFVVPDWWSVVYEGPAGRQIDSGDGLTIRSLIRKWRKERDSETLVVTVPKAQADEARALMKERQWQVA